MGTATSIVVGLQSENTLKVAEYGAAESSAAEAGFIKGGVSIEHDESQYEVKVDQALGPVRKVTTDESMKIKLSLSEATLSNLALAFGYASSAVEDGVFSFGDDQNEAYKTVYVNVKGPGAGSRKYTFWKCRPTGKTSQAYKRDGETLVDVEFDVLCDTVKPAGRRFGQVEDVSAGGSAPTVIMTTPAEGGSRQAGGTAPVVFTITASSAIDESSLRYGDDDDATVMILKQGSPSTLVAGSIAYAAESKTITFTPSSALASGSYIALITTGIRDAAGNHLSAPYVTYFTAA